MKGERQLAVARRPVDAMEAGNSTIKAKLAPPLFLLFFGGYEGICPLLICSLIASGQSDVSCQARVKL